MTWRHVAWRHVACSNAAGAVYKADGVAKPADTAAENQA